MRTDLLTAVFAAQEGMRALRVLRSNPNHVPSGEHGGEFTSGSGGHKKPHGKHWAKRQRHRAKRKRHLERLRKAGHAEIKELKATHKGQHEDMIDSQRHDWRELKKEHKSTRKDFIQEARGERQALRKEHAGERKALVKEKREDHREAQKDLDFELRDHHREGAREETRFTKKIEAAKAKGDETKVAEHEKARDEFRQDHATKTKVAEDWHKEETAIAKADHEKDLKESMTSLKAGHKEAMEYAKGEQRKAFSSLKEDQKQERADRKASDKEDRKDLKIERTKERRELVNALKDEVREHFPKSKTRAPGGENELRAGQFDPSMDGGISLVTARAAIPGRMSIFRTHKASSAEAILKHCLRQLGWTAAWRAGQLAGKQLLKLLEAIRQYGRAWMRHEAEAFFEHYGVRDEQQELGQRSQSAAVQIGDRARDGMRLLDAFYDPQEGASQVRSLSDRILSPLRRWFDRARVFIRELIFAGVMAWKGTTPLDAAEQAEADEAAKIQDQYLDRFRNEIEANPPPEISAAPPFAGTFQMISEAKPQTVSQIIARAEMYGNSVWQSVVNTTHAIMTRQGTYQLERRVLGQSMSGPCGECDRLAALKWQPIGSLPPLGDQECNGDCHCHFEYKDAAGNVIVSPQQSNKMPDSTERVPPPKTGRRPAAKILIQVPDLDQPEGPLSKEQLDEIMSKMKYTMNIVVGSS